MDDRLRGVLLAAGGTVLLSTDSLFIRLADTSSFDVVFWVGALTALVMFGIVAVGDRRATVASLRETGAAVVLLVGALQAATLVLFVVAVQETSVSNVMVIVAAAPLVAAVFSWLLLRERTSVRVWAAIAVTIAGVGVVISGSLGGGSVEGDLYATGAIIAFGLASVILRRYPTLSRPVTVGLGGLFMAIVAAGDATITGHSLGTWLALIAMGGLFGPLARVMIALAPRHLPATEVALFAPVETILASLWAFLALEETPASRTWVGGTIILVAVVWGVWPRSAVAAPEAGPTPHVHSWREHDDLR